jgi:hypothetical protein
MKRFVYISIMFAALVFSVYAVWYTYHRQAIITERMECQNALAHPENAPKMRAPDGTMVPVMTPCLLAPVPPSLGELIHGRAVPSDVPMNMKVNPYTLWDVLLGRYSASPDIGEPCNQSATTTDCSTLPAPAQSEPKPYVPPSPAQPSETWVSATGTPISLFGFSFELPAGWYGSVYRSAYLGSIHILVQSNSSDRGFTIDCPPSGKGLEAATRLSSEQRSFTSGDGTSYSVAFEKWAAPGNDPWYFLWVRTPQSGDSSNGSSGTYCLVQGTATSSVETAMRTMYESLK